MASTGMANAISSRIATRVRSVNAVAGATTEDQSCDAIALLSPRYEGALKELSRACASNR
jgi:hypothetical protein